MSSRRANPNVTGVSERTLLIIAAFIALLEGFDLACYGVTVPSLLHDPSLGITKTTAGLLGSLTAFGMLIGAATAGATVTRAGPRRLILASCGLFSVGMTLCTLAPSVSVFGLGRLLVGLGLGVVLPTLLGYLVDLSSPSRRNRNVGTVMAGYALGGLSAPLLGAALLPAHSFRWIYLVGLVAPLVVLPFALRLLPESPVHLVRVGRGVEATALVAVMGLPLPTVPAPDGRRQLLGLGPLFARGIRTTTILFWAMSFCGLLLVFGISTWLPTIMQASGYRLGSALLQTAAMWTGAGVGTLIGGRVADRVGAKTVVVTAFVVGSASLVLMSTRPNLVLLFVFMFVSGLGFIGSQILVNGLILTRYPDDLRGSGLAWALSAGRPGAILGPILGGWVLSSTLGVEWNFYTFAIVGVLGAVLALMVPRRPPVGRPASPDDSTSLRSPHGVPVIRPASRVGTPRLSRPKAGSGFEGR